MGGWQAVRPPGAARPKVGIGVELPRAPAVVDGAAERRLARLQPYEHRRRVGRRGDERDSIGIAPPRRAERSARYDRTRIDRLDTLALERCEGCQQHAPRIAETAMAPVGAETDGIEGDGRCAGHRVASIAAPWRLPARCPAPSRHATARVARDRSEEHTSDLQSLMRISSAV